MNARGTYAQKTSPNSSTLPLGSQSRGRNSCARAPVPGSLTSHPRLWCCGASLGPQPAPGYRAVPPHLDRCAGGDDAGPQAGAVTEVIWQRRRFLHPRGLCGLEWGVLGGQVHICAIAKGLDGIPCWGREQVGAKEWGLLLISQCCLL